MRHVVAVLEVEVGHQVDSAARREISVLRHHEKPASADGVAREVQGVINHTASARTVANDNVGQPIKRSTRRPSQFKILIDINVRLIDTNLIDDHIAATGCATATLVIR